MLSTNKAYFSVLKNHPSNQLKRADGPYFDLENKLQAFTDPFGSFQHQLTESIQRTVPWVYLRSRAHKT